MPELENERHELFCIALNDGADVEEAYEAAEYAGGNGHGGRLLKRPDILARLAELEAEDLADFNARKDAEAAERAEATARREALSVQIPGSSRIAVVNRLLDIASGAEAGDASGMREARLCLVEAFRMAEAIHEGSSLDNIKRMLGLLPLLEPAIDRQPPPTNAIGRHFSAIGRQMPPLTPEAGGQTVEVNEDLGGPP
ncbi:MAG TPA: hypothetical protein VG248_06205 [Caulobacteraceae bacterium]|jgi:hypothetical protein|nr:hypothetical protein [Caulobacteraceae bacterium]